jgi:hypothetical protein
MNIDIVYKRYFCAKWPYSGTEFILFHPRRDGHVGTKRKKKEPVETPQNQGHSCHHDSSFVEP